MSDNGDCEVVEVPKVGSRLWFVRRHYYYDVSFMDTDMEYCIVSGKVTDVLANDRGSPEIRLRSVGPDNYAELNLFQVKEIGLTLFHSPTKAAERAFQLTERCEAQRGKGCPPMRRSWEFWLDMLDKQNQNPPEPQPEPECTEYKVERYVREKQKLRYNERKAAGLCTSCGKPAAPGRTMCSECLLRASERGKRSRMRRRR